MDFSIDNLHSKFVCGLAGQIPKLARKCLTILGSGNQSGFEWSTLQGSVNILCPLQTWQYIPLRTCQKTRPRPANIGT